MVCPDPLHFEGLTVTGGQVGKSVNRSLEVTAVLCREHLSYISRNKYDHRGYYVLVRVKIDNR